MNEMGKLIGHRYWIGCQDILGALFNVDMSHMDLSDGCNRMENNSPRSVKTKQTSSLILLHQSHFPQVIAYLGSYIERAYRIALS